MHMADGSCQCTRGRCDPESGISSENPGVHRASGRRSRWTNGQCVVAVTTPSILTPTFDLELCRKQLEEEGFHVPVEDFETPLRTVLEPPSIRRYLFFNSSLFHFILAPIMYVVLWCAVYSSLHVYLNESVVNLWVLCLCVSSVVVVVTVVIVLVFHYSNKEINVNTDVRLVKVNERLVGHGLLLGVADWIEKCTGKMQLCCVFWDLGPCLRTLTETLEGLDLVRDEIKNKVKKRMSHLVVVAEVPPSDPDDDGDRDDEIGEEPDEGRPLLGRGRESCAVPKKRQEVILTQTFNLLPDFTLSYQDIANHLLMIYSAVYVKLLVTERLPNFDSERNHCATAPLCLCQYVRYKLLQ